MAERDESSARFPTYLKLGLLVGVMGLLLIALVVQRHGMRRAQEEHEANKPPLPFVKKDYDNARLRAKMPLETPDYLGEPGFELVGNDTHAGAPIYEEAKSRSERIQALKAQKMKASSRTPFALPPSSELPTEKDFAKRYLAFRMRELQAYRALTKDQGEVKAAGERFLESYIRNMARTGGTPAEEELVKLARQVTELGSVDPLLRSYAAYVLYMKTGDALAAEAVWSEAIQQLRGTMYPRIVSLYVRVFANDVAKNMNRNVNERRRALVVAVVRWLEQEIWNPDWADCVYYKVNQMWQVEGVKFQEELACGCLNSGKVDPFIVHWLLGDRHITRGWTQRGGGWAHEVRPEHWEGFQMHLELGAAHLEYAWFLNPDSPYPPSRLISVAMAGHDEDYQAYDWFLRAIESRFDHPPAYSRLMTALMPRWGGSFEHFEQFSRACLETERFDTLVPYVFLDILEFAREREFDGNWARLDQVGANALIDDFLRRRDRYRQAHPGQELWGDSAVYRTKLGRFLENLDRPVEALSEFRAAQGNVDAVQLQEGNRPGRYLLRRLHAAQEPVRERVLAFDRQLRNRWPADTDPKQLEPLEQELRELRETALDDPAREYYRHVERILAQLKAYFRGEWVELDLSDGGLGWEIRADVATFTEGVDEVLLSRERIQTPQVSARPLAHFEPPFIVEAEIGHEMSSVPLGKAGAHWSRLDRGMDPDTDRMQPFVGLVARQGISHSLLRGRPGRAYYSESASFTWMVNGAFEQQWMPRVEPGLLPLAWRLWNASYEVRIGRFWRQIQLPKAIAEDGVLNFGEPIPRPDFEDRRKHAGKWRLANVRIRRLQSAPPPRDEAPLTDRKTYWTRRVADDPHDAIARIQLCKILWEEGAYAEVAESADRILEEFPDLGRVHRMKGEALARLGRYCEALDALGIAVEEPFDDREAWLAAAEVLAAAPDDSLRDARRAVALAKVSQGHAPNPPARALAILAAAYAEAGDFPKALETNRQAIQQATGEFQEQLRHRQKLYEANQPYRLPTAKEMSPG